MFDRPYTLMPISRLLIAMRDIENARLVEVIALNLQSDRQTLVRHPAWQR